MIFSLQRTRNCRFMRVWRQATDHPLRVQIQIASVKELKSLIFLLQRGIFVAGLKEEIVSNAEQVLKLIESGEGLDSETKHKYQGFFFVLVVSFNCIFVQNFCLCFYFFTVNRHFGETNMNARSSRSHTIFRMVCGY